MKNLSRALLATLFAFPLASAKAAPAGLYGKTVKVGWTETRSQRNAGDTAFHPASFPFTYTVYVSTQGQLFRRIFTVSSTRKQSGSRDAVGTGGRTDSGGSQVGFQGNNLVSTSSSGGIGRRIRVSFDANFSSCSAEVLTGKTGAGPASMRALSSGKTVEIESVSAGSASCSIQNGNAFAD
jgi:hypothetical protein